MRNIGTFIDAILMSSKQTKGELGQKYAKLMGFDPGPSGGDGGIDGWQEYDGLNVYFQSKLHKKNLDITYARRLKSLLLDYEVDICIYFSGVGYSSGFIDYMDDSKTQLYQLSHVKMHFLTLYDLYYKTEDFFNACNDFPPLCDNDLTEV